MTLPASGPLTFSDIQTEFGGSNPIALGEYYAGGGLVPAGTSGTYGAVPSSGALSVQNFYGTSAVIPVYIEDVFSTWLYTGTGATQTITNGINLSANGGLTWCKGRSNPYDHYLFDTVRGANNYLISNYTGAQNAFGTYSNLLTSFNTNGFSLGADSLGSINVNNVTYASWTFQEKPKFFDIVTYTGTGSTSLTVNHNLGSEPGCIIIKWTSGTGYGWYVYHRSMSGTPQASCMTLNGTGAAFYLDGDASNSWIIPSSTNFQVSTTDGGANASGESYVAYLFAHNAGGFGLTGTDNVISCGSYTGDGGVGTTAITLGYEPQWILVKSTTNVDNWGLFDNMRGLCVDNNASNDARLIPNTSNVESLIGAIEPTATGFKTTLFTNYNQSGQNYIYIAIRRGPMKVPTVGTSVFSPNYATSTTGQQITTGFPVDSQILRYLPAGIGGYWFDRLRGVSTTTTESGQALYPNATTAETLETYTRYFNNTGYQQNSGFPVGTQMIGYSFGRAPSFFDEVCYTGTGVAGRTVTHNLTVTPELMIVKGRSNAGQWRVYSSALGATQAARLNSTDSFGSNPYAWNNTAPTSAVFTVGDDTGVNENTYTYVSYLFATCAGVSKVGSYTGNGTTQTINCSFTTGARFVLIKRTDSTGAWYVYDTVRGMTTLTDPYLLLNSTAAQTATLGSVTTVSTGFALNSAILADINVSAGTYIFLAIA